MPQVWQTIVAIQEAKSVASGCHENSISVRFDTAHHSLPTPSLFTPWSEQIGWHRSIDELSAPPLPSPSPKFDRPIASPSPVTRTGLPASTPPVDAVLSVQNSERSERAQFKQLLAEAAHDIRSPIAVAQQLLRSLSGRAEYRSSAMLDELEMLEEAQVRLTQAMRWTEGILLDQSLAHGQPVNTRRRFFPLQWLGGVTPLFESLAAQRGVALEWIGWDRSLPRLYLDSNHLSRIVLNLVSNAIKASRAGSQVAIRVAWQTEITQQLVITIEDRGCGMSADLMQRVNAPTLWPTAGESAGGIGLRTAKALVRAIGGSLQVQRRHRGGTAFRISLPVDNYHSLVRSWLLQNARQRTNPADRSRKSVEVYAVRGADCIADQTDTTLQQAASSQDFVYRAARNRWLWITLSDRSTRARELPARLESGLEHIQLLHTVHGVSSNCLAQKICQLGQLTMDELQTSGHQSTFALPRITSVIAEKLAELTADHVPILDDLDAVPAPLAIRPSQREIPRMIRIDPVQVRPGPVMGAAKYRQASLADMPCDMFSGALAELSQQWRASQRGVDAVNTALSRRAAQGEHADFW